MVSSLNKGKKTGSMITFLFAVPFSEAKNCTLLSSGDFRSLLDPTYNSLSFPRTTGIQ